MDNTPIDENDNTSTSNADTAVYKTQLDFKRAGEIEAELQREARKDMVSLRNLRAYISRLPKVFKLFMFLWSHKKI